MRRYADYQEIESNSPVRRVVTIGNFDGVHLGHRSIIDRARNCADEIGGELAILTFTPHPVELLRPEQVRMRLVEHDRKAELLQSCGVDLVLEQRFDHAFAGKSSKSFARCVLSEALAASVVIVGENFRFGKGREGDVELLRSYGEHYGFEVRGLELVERGDTEISSSRIRRMIQEGDVAGAAELLGRHHEIPGMVISGHARGREMGFPTANLGEVSVLIPGPGIYAGLCELDGEFLPAAVYIGDRPTLGHGFSVEAHLIGFSGDLYNCRVVLHFLERVRGEKHFDSEKQLVEQMRRDVMRACEILEVDGE